MSKKGWLSDTNLKLEAFFLTGAFSQNVDKSKLVSDNLPICLGKTIYGVYTFRKQKIG